MYSFRGRNDFFISPSLQGCNTLLYCKTLIFGDYLFLAFLADKAKSLKYKFANTVVISTSIISNNRLSRRENLVIVLTQKSKIRLQNMVEAQFLPFSTIFSIYISTKGVKLHSHL